MKKCKWVTLGEIAEKIGSGLTPRGGDSTYRSSGVPFIRSQNVHLNRFEKSGLAYISDQQDSEMVDSRVLPGDVLLNITGASIGRVCTAPAELCPANVNQHVCIIRTSGRVNPRFLAFFLATPGFQSFIVNNQSGATRQALTKGQIEEFRVPQPEEEIQQRVVAILERADRLRRLRRFQVEAAETLLFAAFRKIFGSRFERGSFFRLIDLVKITGGGTPERERPEYFRGRIPWLTSKDMRSDYIWDTEEHITEEGIENSSTNLVPVNSILLVVKSKVLMHRLPVAIAKVPICHGQDVKSIQCSAKLHHEFARFVLKYHERRLLQVARGANTEGLTLPMLEELPVPKVDMTEQETFASLVQRVERLRAVHREALRQAEHLFQTLLQRAFTRGL